MNTLRILLVEDDVEFAQLFSLYAKRISRDWQVTRAESLRQAIDHLVSADLIVCDLDLADFERAETIEVIHRWSKQWPVIVFTGACDSRIEASCFDAGVQSFLCKDRIDSESIVSAIQLAAEHSSSAVLANYVSKFVESI